MTKAVLCFDRDLTVSVNFTTENQGFMPDDAEPVPLAWVKYWAHHDPRVDVWATGNQHLRKEAAIPGFEELHQLWQEHVGPDVVAEYEPAGANPYKPTRRRGLEMIKEFYDNVDDVDPEWFVVVDDVDVSDVDGFEHFYPWDFRDWLEDSVPTDELPVCNEPAQSNACDCRTTVTALRERIDE